LRGYPLRYQAGTARALLTLEERFYTKWTPLKLLDVGVAVFFDAGRTWGHDAVADGSLGLLKDIGVGLRLGSARSSRGKVVHIDLAYPLDRAGAGVAIDRVQLLLETRTSI
jgi:outer membrane protein assembly factor BamA